MNTSDESMCAVDVSGSGYSTCVLIRHHPDYRAIEIDQKRLSQLPGDGCMIDHVPTIPDDDAEVDNEDAEAHEEEAGDGHTTAGTSRVCSPFLSILLSPYFHEPARTAPLAGALGELPEESLNVQDIVD